jgi:hypothetical protein
MRHIRNEQIRAETAAILRFARVIEIKRRALNPIPVLNNPLEPIWKRPPQKKPRVLFVLPEKYGIIEDRNNCGLAFCYPCNIIFTRN